MTISHPNGELIVTAYVRGHKKLGNQIWKNFESDEKALKIFKEAHRKDSAGKQVYAGIKILRR